MKNRKTITAFIVLVMMLLLFLGITLYTSILSYMEVSSQAELTVRGMIEMLNHVQTNIDSLEDDFKKITENSMEMMCIALQTRIHGENYTGPESFEDGVVVKAEDGMIIYPESFSGRFDTLTKAGDLETLETMSSATLLDGPENTRPVLISSRLIGGNYYYIDWWEMDDYQTSINYEKYIRDGVRSLEQLYSASLILVGDSDDLPLLYASEALGKPQTISDLGITPEDISSQASGLTINKKTYTAAYEKLRAYDRSAYAIILLNPIGNNVYILNCLVMAAGFILVCISALILWIHWIEVYMRDHELTEFQKKAWQLAQLRKTSAATAMNGAILLFILLTGYQLVGNMARISNYNQESVNLIMARMKEVTSASYEAESWETYFANRIADLYNRVPECRNEEFLKRAAELTGCEYIMIFDNNGDELLASNGYVGLTLGDGVNTEDDFRYLLNGISQIVGEPRIDKFSGKMIRLTGVKMDMEAKDSYGAVIIGFDPQMAREIAETKELDNYIKMVTRQDNLSIIVGRESGRVFYSSSPSLIGREPAEFGLDNADLSPISMESFEINGKKHFGAYNEDDSYDYYYMTDADNIWGDSVKFAGFSSLYYLLTCFIVSSILLGRSSTDYARGTENWKDRLKKISDLSKDPEVLDNFRETERDNRSFKEWWNDIAPEQKVGHLLKILCTLLLIILFITLLTGEDNSSRSVINFILHGNWKRGFNELAILAIICCLILLLAVILIKDLLVRSLNSMLNAKGKTVVGLISSLIQYISIITSIFFCLAYLGFDTSVLITSASILTLAISLGSKDLVADILSGIFIIFEGDFHVGDIIEVNGFKGMVMDIGVRSTKLRDTSHNIKIIDNQSVKNILNLSKELSWFFINLTVSTNQPLEEIEMMLDRELPKIREEIPTIISGPYYNGISTIDYHRLSLSVGAECRQKDVTKTRTELNHVLWELFTKNGLQL